MLFAGCPLSHLPCLWEALGGVLDGRVWSPGVEGAADQVGPLPGLSGAAAAAAVEGSVGRDGERIARTPPTPGPPVRAGRTRAGIHDIPHSR